MKPRVSALLAISTLLVTGACALLQAARADEKTIDWQKAKEHWSFRAPRVSRIPAVKNAGWIRQPVDRFILAKLEQSHLTPSPEADSRTLIRRVTLDLTGLPPTPDEVAAFVKERQA